MRRRRRQCCYRAYCIGAEAYGKIRTQLKPGNPQGKTFAEVVAAAKIIYKQQLTNRSAKCLHVQKKERKLICF